MSMQHAVPSEHAFWECKCDRCDNALRVYAPVTTEYVNYQAKKLGWTVDLVADSALCRNHSNT